MPKGDIGESWPSDEELLKKDKEEISSSSDEEVEEAIRELTESVEDGKKVIESGDRSAGMSLVERDERMLNLWKEEFERRRKK